MFNFIQVLGESWFHSHAVLWFISALAHSWSAHFGSCFMGSQNSIDPQCLSNCWEMSSLSFGSFLALNRLFRTGTKLTCPFLGFLLGATLLLICICASDSMLLLGLHGLHPVATTVQSSIQRNSITESSCSSGRSMSWLQLSLTLLPSLVCPPVSVTPFYMAV